MAGRLPGVRAHAGGLVTAPASPPIVDTALTHFTDAALRVDPHALKAGALALRETLEEAQTLTVSSEQEKAIVGAILIDQLKTLDVMQEQRDGVTKPLHAGWQRACELFKEGLDLQKAICDALKKAIGNFELAQLAAKEQATQEARAALVSGDVQAIERSLSVVNAPTQKAQGVSTGFMWKVARLVEPVPCQYCGSRRGMIPQQYWLESANEKALDELARHAPCGPGDEPPIVPGVVFERAASVTGRRK
jgi:hypothetical protein